MSIYWTVLGRNRDGDLLESSNLEEKKSGWSRVEMGGLPVFAARGINFLPGVVQGFTTRHGGISRAPYDTFNLGPHCGDDAEFVAANRARLAAALAFPTERCVYAEQVHGSSVSIVRAAPAPGAPLPRVDALVTDTPGVLLVLQYADCFPVYLVEPNKRVVALLHSGWRGTAANIVQAATETMVEGFGIDPARCFAAIGPGIGGEIYEVGEDVAGNFAKGYEHTTLPVAVPIEGDPGKWHLYLQRAIYAQLLACGYSAEAIAVSGEDTYANAADLFSHRREAQWGSKTGRMVGFLGLRYGGAG